MQLTTAHNSPQAQRGRESFAFALIGCVIWDSGSGVKLSEEEKGEDEEEALELVHQCGGWATLTLINVNTP